MGRGEGRVKNVNYFKTVKITNEPGSAPDRIVINVELEEQSTGEFSFAGGYSTADGLLGEVSVGERNLLGRGQMARAAVQYGTRARGFELSFVEPYLMGERLALGLDIFAKQTTSATYVSYTSQTIGGNIRFGIPITDNWGTTVKYTAYQQKISLPQQFMNCNNINPSSANGTFPTPDQQGRTDPATGLPFTQNCFQDGEASLAVRKELAAAPVFGSIGGYGVTHHTPHNNRHPHSGPLFHRERDLGGGGRRLRSIQDINHPPPFP